MFVRCSVFCGIVLPIRAVIERNYIVMVSGEDVVRALLKNQKIATLAELKGALATSSTMTVFRKLKSLGYQTSYSHRGKYYTLSSIPRFDSQGLWSYRNVWFSREGSLLDSAQRCVDEAVAGRTSSELQGMRRVEVKEPLLQLYRRQRVARAQIEGSYVYFSKDPGVRRQQLLERRKPSTTLEIGDTDEAAE